MKAAVRRTIFLTPLGLWAAFTVAGVLGVTAGSGTDLGTSSVRALAPKTGYLINSGGHVIGLNPSPIPFCWVCGREQQGEVLLLDASHLKGTWLYRIPANDPDLTGYSPERAAEALELARVLAYDFATGNKLVAPADSSIDGKQQILEAKGFVADEAHKLTPAMREQWPEVSMTRGGCVVAQTVFMIFALFWLVGWGAWWLIGRKRSRALTHI